MVLTTFPFLQFLRNFDVLIKKQDFCSNHWWEPFFHHPKITKIHINKIFMFDATDVFAREVLQKSISALPCCMGSIFSFASMQHGSAIFAVCNTSRARRHFLFFFNTSPARITKMEKIALRSHVVEASARKVQLQTSAANLRPAPVSTIGMRFSTSQTKT